MSELIDMAFDEAKEQATNAMEHLVQEFSKLRTGKASSNMLSSLLVEYYGSTTPLSQVANVSASDSRTLTIQPWDKTAIDAIERAIFEANLGLTPQNDGELIRITIPPLTHDRRLELVKKSKAITEDTKISLRTIRRDILDVIKQEVKDGFPEDRGKKEEDNVKEFLENHYKKAEALQAVKEKDILTI